MVAAKAQIFLNVKIPRHHFVRNYCWRVVAKIH